ncbi:MAG: hypothetical protein ABSC06_12855 [Rhodopila sp.]
MADTTDARFERLRAVAATSNLRSPLARWLSANHVEFEKLLKDYRPRWEALVEQLGADGLLKLPPEFTSDDQKIRQLTRRRVVKAAMRTWERVKLQVAQKSTSQSNSKSAAPVASAPGRRSLSLAPPIPVEDHHLLAADRDEPDHEPPPKFTFRPTKLR